jgi:hypothetical protein
MGVLYVGVVVVTVLGSIGGLLARYRRVEP